MTDSDMIAAFLAKHGATRCAEGEATLTSREVYKAVRGVRPASYSDADLINQRHVTLDSIGREYVTNGLGERIT